MELIRHLTQRNKPNLAVIILGLFFILGTGEDIIPPVVTVNGENPISVILEATYVDAGATAIDETDGKIDVITTGVDTINTSIVGVYTVTYVAQDSAGNKTKATRTVTVIKPKDIIPPVVTVNGENPISVILEATYVDAGATAIDETDGKIDVITTGVDTINTSIVGVYTVTYVAQDSAGNKTKATRTVTVIKPSDSEAPKIVATDKKTISDITQALSFNVTDASLINANSLMIKVNGISRSALGKYTDGKIKIIPDAANYWQAGSLTIVISLADRFSNISTTTFTYIVQPVTTALPIARPSSGFAPLSVFLTPFNTTNSAITSYEWDFDNDGNFDVRETVGIDQKHLFNTPGKHTVTLKITDAKGNKTTGTVDVLIKNQPPVIVSATASPSNGSVPLIVNFTARVQDHDGIALYEWDFEGDGTFDKRDALSSTASHTYTTEGKYQPVLRVKDKLGVITTYALSDIEVQTNPKDYPTVSLSASPQQGDAPLIINFKANSRAVSPRTLTRWEWDFNGDKTYNETTTTDSVKHTYTEAGDYYVRVRVTDSDNQSSEDVIKVTVNASVSLSLSTDTIDIATREKTTIKTVIGADSIVSVVIEDKFGLIVKTLVPKGKRKAGTYDDKWGGNNDKGKPVAEGEYRAVLLYEVGGVEKRLDLSTTTGGQSYSPKRTRIPARFQPFADKPLIFDFTLPQASNVTAFMGNFRGGAGERLMTFIQRRPMGKGTHRITWNGEDNNGKLIKLPVNETFIIGIFAYKFAANGLYVRSGANITKVVRTPSILVPDSVNKPMTKLSFELSNKADVRLIIHNAETGKVVATFNFTGLAIGNNEITWNGKNNQGIYVKPAKYRLGITAIDANGYQSMTQYVVQQVYY